MKLLQCLNGQIDKINNVNENEIIIMANKEHLT